MSALRALVRRGSYHDSVVLMQLQRALDSLPGVLKAGVVMATPANRDVLAESDLLAPEAASAQADDLVIAVRAESAEALEAALGQADELLKAKRPAGDSTLRPRTLGAALAARPQARWVLVSVPGRYAAAVTREALESGRNVFLYSDNVPLVEEVAIKAEAARRGLLVLGPDCGTAIVAGAGLGFGNRVRSGSIGLVGASGTGLQTVVSRIHALGGGVRAALGTGGRDLAREVGAVTALQALDLLASDSETSVIVLISKPPSPEVATRVLAAARACDKPVVVHFLGQATPAPRIGNLYFSRSLAEAAEIAVGLAADVAGGFAADMAVVGAEGKSSGEGGLGGDASESAGGAAVTQKSSLFDLPGGAEASLSPRFNGAHGTGRYLRALFSGGTLGYEALLGLRVFLGPIWSNAPIAEAERLPDPNRSREHTLLDLGADEFTLGKPHPMLDPALVAERLTREAADSEVGVILLDVVLGDGAHADPASLLAGSITAARERGIAVVALLVGTDQDPQGLEAQAVRLARSGARVVGTVAAAIETVLALLPPVSTPAAAARVDPEALAVPLSAINVGVEAFAESLAAQGAEALHVDWRPPAGGNEKLQSILARMKTVRG